MGECTVKQTMPIVCLPFMLKACHSMRPSANSELKWSNLRRLISRVIKTYTKYSGRSGNQWLTFPRRRSTAARVLRLWVRIPSGYGCLSVVTVVFYHVEVSAKSLSLIQMSPNDRGASLCVCDLGTSWRRRPWPTGAICAKIKKNRSQI